MIDRLMHLASPLILIMAAIITMTTVSQPKRRLTCHYSESWTNSLISYAESVCSSGQAKYSAPAPSLFPSSDSGRYEEVRYDGSLCKTRELSQ